MITTICRKYFFQKLTQIRANLFMLGIEGVGEREDVEWVVREGVGAGGRNDPSIEKKNKRNKK
jgi:hypothetical protein